MKKQIGFILVVSALVLAGCQKKETEKTKASTATTSVSSTIESSTEESKETASDFDDWVTANEQVKDKTKAEKLTVLYKNNDVQVQEDHGVSLTIHGYEYLQIDNFDRNLRNSFGDQREVGGVLLLPVTIENESKDSVYTLPAFKLVVNKGGFGYVGRAKDIIEDDLFDTLQESGQETKPGEKVSGYITVSIKPEVMEQIELDKEAELEVPRIYSVKSGYKAEDEVLKTTNIKISLSDEKKEVVKEVEGFYNDKATTDNWGNKTMLNDKQVNETKNFEDFSVTFNGYQFTEFVPNSEQAPRFRDFKEGIVLLTADVTVSNNSKETLSFISTSAALDIGNSFTTLNTLALEASSETDKLAPGKEASKFFVFMLDKEAYDKLYKDQKKLLDVSLYAENYERITDIDDIAFEFK